MAEKEFYKLNVSGYPSVNKQKIIDAKDDQPWLFEDSKAWVAFLHNPPYTEPPDETPRDGGDGNGGEHTREFVKSFDAFVPLNVPLVNTTTTRRPYVPVLGIKEGAQPRLLLLTGFEEVSFDEDNPLDDDALLELQTKNYGAYHWNCQWQYDREDSLQILAAMRIPDIRAQTSQTLPRSLRALWRYVELHATPGIAMSEEQLQLACNNVCIVHVDASQEEVFYSKAEVHGSDGCRAYLESVVIAEDLDRQNMFLQAASTVKHEEWEPSEALVKQVDAEVKEVVAAVKEHKREVEAEKAPARKKGKAVKAAEKKEEEKGKKGRSARATTTTTTTTTTPIPQTTPQPSWPARRRRARA